MYKMEEYYARKYRKYKTKYTTLIGGSSKKYFIDKVIPEQVGLELPVSITYTTDYPTIGGLATEIKEKLKLDPSVKEEKINIIGNGLSYNGLVDSGEKDDFQNRREGDFEQVLRIVIKDFDPENAENIRETRKRRMDQIRKDEEEAQKRLHAQKMEHKRKTAEAIKERQRRRRDLLKADRQEDRDRKANEAEKIRIGDPRVAGH